MAFLRRLFGPSRDEVWRELCRQIGADFVEGGRWRGNKVEAHVGAWTVTLDTYTVSTGKTHVTFTRMRAPYVNRDGFRFCIDRKNIFSGLGKLLGMQDIEVGHAPLDDAFILQGNDESKVVALCESPRIRELLLAQPSIALCVRNDEGWFGARFPQGVDELYFQTVGVIVDLPRLKALYDLFAETLNHLCQIGSAYEDDPGVKL
jgi:hypothetical protein